MEISLTTIQVLLFIGAAQGFLLAITLLSARRANRQANHFLAGILIIFGLNITLHATSHPPYLFIIPFHESIITIIFFLFGPFFYFYVRALTRSKLAFRKQDLLHFLPFMLGILTALPFYLISLNSGSPHFVIEILSALVVIHVVWYMMWTIKLLLDHSRSIKNSFSSLDKINLHWLQFLIISFTLTWLVALYFDIQGNGDSDWDYVWLLVSLLIYIIGYKGWRQPEIFNVAINYPPEKAEMKKKKYEKSAMTSDLAASYLKKLENYMKSAKPHLNSNLTLPQLAAELSISVHHLSQVINQNRNQNFFEYVNQYRVEEAKQALNDQGKEHLSIAAIGFDSGFNSNSSFNAVFKKITGLTPSQFRKSNR